jgi:hypothetical protein
LFPLSYIEQSAAFEYANAIAQFKGLFLIVSDEDGGYTEPALNVFEASSQLGANAHIESAERFVEQQHGRLIDQSARKRDSLLLASGELMGITVAQSSETYSIKEPLSPALSLFLCDLSDLQSEFDVLGNRHMAEDRIVLKNESGASFLWRKIGDIFPVKKNSSGVGSDQAGDQSEDRTLAASARAKQDEQLSVCHFEGHVVYDWLVPIDPG